MEQRLPTRDVLFGPVVVLLATGCAAALFGWSFVETRTQEAELRSVTAEQGMALVEALGHAIENALASSREIEELGAVRLLDTARLLARLDAATHLASADLQRIVSDLSLRRIALLDPDLREIAASGAARDPWIRSKDPRSERVLRSLASGAADEAVFDPAEEPGTGAIRFGAAVRRTGGGVLVVVMDAAEMLSFRESIGVAPLIDAVAATGGVIQVVLEDNTSTVLAGTPPPQPASGTQAIVFEHGVLVAPGKTGRLRIALSGDALAAAGRAARRRMLAAAAVGLGLAVALGTVVASHRRIARLRSVTDAILDGMEDAVVVVGTDGVIQRVNPAACRLFAGNPRSLVGAPCRSTPCDSLRDLIGTGGAPREVRLERSDTSRVLVLASASPVRDGRGRTVGTAILLRDLTETKRLEMDARRSESLAAFGRLAATVAHEVRNPLNAISVGVQRLAVEFPPSIEVEEQLRLVRILREEIERLDGIVGRFLELARPPRLAPVPGDLDAHVRATLSLLSDAVPAGVRVVLEPGNVPPTIFDPAALRQILLNLLRNSVEAVGSAGSVRVATRAAGDRAVIEVADDGNGIAAEDLDRIFEFGFTTKPAGNGLGLPVVHRLATEMDGSVAVDSAPGAGTTVRVTLPLAAHLPAERFDS